MRSRQQRIGQSIWLSNYYGTAWKTTSVRTKIMIPSASFSQRPALLVSSSSTIFEYIVKRGPELSLALASSCDCQIGDNGGWLGSPSTMQADEFGGGPS